MLALLSSWNWTEVAEGVTVSLAFVLAPVLAHAELRHRKLMRSHCKLHERLDRLGAGDG